MSKSIVLTSILCGGAFALLIAGNTHAATAAHPSAAALEPTTQACELAADSGADQPQHPPRPPSCEEASDCSQACPPDALSCTCAPNPHGDKICVPVCASDEDCPSGRGPKLSCDTQEGICVPSRPAGGGRGPGEQGPGGK